MGRQTMSQRSILLMFHCEQNTGYAIESLERTFAAAALKSGYSKENTLWSYTKVYDSKNNVFEMGYYTHEDAEKFECVCNDHNVDTILAFDMPYPTKVARRAKKLGIRNIISYWGASMSSLNSGVKLLAKKLEWSLRSKAAPSHFIFESEAMRITATDGRGVPRNRTCVVPLGVDTEKYKPNPNSKYAHLELNIPIDRKILFFSGHMEERKGVRVLIEAMNTLSNLNEIEPFHLLICGNKADESLPYEQIIRNETTRDHITFAGYRNDIPRLMESSFIGIIASTGWDSFTMSSIEMMASGLPLIVSNLQGLAETISPNKTGLYIEPGDYKDLARKIIHYHREPDTYYEHSKQARERVLAHFSIGVQIESISQVISTGKEALPLEPIAALHD